MSEQLYRHSEKARFAYIDDEVVALNIEAGNCYGMDKIAATVWGLLAEPNDVGNICDRLVEIYDVEPDICRAEVARLIQHFQSEGLLDQVDPSK